MAKEKIVYESFDSIAQLLTALESRPNNSVFASTRESHKVGNGDFAGTETYEEAITLARTGWAEPLERLKEVSRAAGIKTNVVADKNRPITGVVGYAPCVPNAIRGLPNSMIMTEHVPSKVKAVTIVYSPCDVGGASTESYIKAGVAVLGMVQQLELAGYRVRLQAEFKSSKENNEYAIVRVTLKDWRHPVDLKKLTFPLANSAMQRRIGFHWMETVPTLTEMGWNWGYGCTISKVTSYEKQLDFYKKHGLLKENEYFITKHLCEDKRYNVDDIMATAGMKL